MSLDEVAMMHEATIDLVQSALELPPFLRWGWMIPALVVMFVFVAWQWRFFKSLPAWLRTRLALAGLVYVVGAVGLEMVESQIANTMGEEEASTILQLLVGLEEGLEMAAAAAALLFILRYVALLAPSWSAVIDTDQAATPVPQVRTITIAGSARARTDPDRRDTDPPDPAGSAEATPTRRFERAARPASLSRGDSSPDPR